MVFVLFDFSFLSFLFFSVRTRKGFVFPLLTSAGPEESIEGVRQQMLLALQDSIEQLEAGITLKLSDGTEAFVRGCFLCFSADLPALAKVLFVSCTCHTSNDAFFFSSGHRLWAWAGMFARARVRGAC